MLSVSGMDHVVAHHPGTGPNAIITPALTKPWCLRQLWPTSCATLKGTMMVSYMLFAKRSFWGFQLYSRYHMHALVTGKLSDFMVRYPNIHGNIVQVKQGNIKYYWLRCAVGLLLAVVRLNGFHRLVINFSWETKWNIIDRTAQVHKP